jgi:hypothetical protein
MFRCFAPPPPTLRLVLGLFFLLIFTMTEAPAQDGSYEEWLERESQALLQSGRARQRGAVGAEHVSRVREELEIKKEALERERRYSYAEPVLSPDGKPLAAMVNERYMTLEDLNLRVRTTLRGAPPLRHPDPETQRIQNEDRVLSIANDIIEDWIMNTMLALQARNLGFTASEAEVDDALRQVREAQAESMGGAQGGGATTAAVSALGIPEAQLRHEVRDALVIEKYMNSLIDAAHSREDYERLYRLDPVSFRVPDRVRAFHVFYPIDRRLSDREFRAIDRDFNRLQRRLRRADEKAMAEMIQESSGQRWTAGDMGWVTSHITMLPPQVYQGLFSHGVGETSPVFQSSEGMHILKILEREDGSAPGLDAAIPQIRNYLFTRHKYATYEMFKPLYDIRMNTGGVKRWREVSADEYEHLKRRGKIEAPDTSITITELRRQIEAERGGDEVTERAPAPAQPPARSSAARAEPPPPAVDLSILQ